MGCSPWGHYESDTTERLHFHFSFSCVREGNGNPLQCSCLENPRDGGAWWAAVCGVAQSWTRLKRLSSSILYVSKGIYLFAVNRAHIYRLIVVTQAGKESACNGAMGETWVQSLGWEDLLEKGMATHSSILAWRIPWTEEPSGLQSMGLQRVGHD